MMIAPVTIDSATRMWLVRKLIDWGYLDAEDLIEDDEDIDEVLLGQAIGRALPRIVLEAERMRRQQH